VDEFLRAVGLGVLDGFIADALAVGRPFAAGSPMRPPSLWPNWMMTKSPGLVVSMTFCQRPSVKNVRALRPPMAWLTTLIFVRVKKRRDAFAPAPVTRARAAAAHGRIADDVKRGQRGIIHNRPRVLCAEQSGVRDG
jgi:hypothetical protein